jgi:transcriptional regulator with XRE-family HTH domain
MRPRRLLAKAVATMTEQQKKAKSSIERPRLQEDPESKVWMPANVQDLASPLANGPGHVADTNNVVANEGQPLDCRLSPTAPPEVAKHLRPIVKRLWLVLTDPGRPCDSASVEYRLGVIRFLEKLMRTEFASSADLRQHMERFLDGHDGRRLPVPQAIKRARKKLHLTQRQLAELLNFKDHTLISKIESGKRLPSAKVLEWLSRTENVTEKGPVHSKPLPPPVTVTSNRGKEAGISPILGRSETSKKQEECTPADSGHFNSTPEVL